MKFIPNKANREQLSWLGGGVAAIVGAAWVLFTHSHEVKKPAAPMANVVNSSGSIIAPGGTFNGPVSVFDEKKNSEQLNAALEPLRANYERLAAAMARDKGVEAAPLRAILLKLGEKGVRDQDIPMLLDQKAEELVTLRRQLAELQRGSQDLASSVQQTQALLDKGDFNAALNQLSDFQKAMAISSEIQSDAEKQKQERWRILTDIQAQIFAIQNDVTGDKLDQQNKTYSKWDEYLRN